MDYTHRDGPKILTSQGQVDGARTTIAIDNEISLEPQLLYSLSNSEEIVQLDTLNRSPPVQSLLPGLTEERRFHNAYPDIVLPHSLLRAGLREDFQLSTVDGGSDHSLCHDGHIAIGFARGPQRRFQECILSSTSTTPDVLHVSLLKTRPIVVTSRETEVHGAKLAIDSGSSNLHRFRSTIRQIVGCQGGRNSFFAVRTENEVHVTSIAFGGSKKAVHLQVSVLFSAASGQRPTACVLFYTDRLHLVVFTADGLLRIWETTDSHSSSHPDFRIRHTMRGAERSVCSLNIISSVKNNNSIPHLLLTSDTMIEFVDFRKSTVRNVFIADPRELFRSVVPVKSYTDEKTWYFAVISSRRLLLLAFDHDELSMRIKVTWTHHHSSNEHLALIVRHSVDNLDLVLHGKTSGVCSVFGTRNTSQGIIGLDPCRFDLGGQHIPVSIISYPIKLTGHQGNSNTVLTGLYFLTRSDALVGSVCTSDQEMNVRTENFRQYKGPNFVVDDSEDEETPQITSKRATLLPDYDGSTNIDLSAWYKSLVSLRASEHVQTCEMNSTSSEATKPYLKLAHELTDLSRTTLDDIDQTLEDTFRTYRDKALWVESTAGLRPPALNYAVVESDGHPSLEIGRLMRVWQGERTLTRGRYATEYRDSIDLERRKAADLLTLSTAVFSDHLSSEAAELSLAGLRNIPQLAGSGRAVNRLLDEWDSEQDISLYVWRSFEEDPKEVSSVGPIQQIPNFLGESELPPRLASTQAVPPVFSLTQGQHQPSSQGDFQISMTQPVPGRYGGDRKQSKRKKAGF